MGRISHLIPEEAAPQAFSLEGVINQVIEELAQRAYGNVAPDIKKVVQAVNENGARGDNSVNKATAALRKAIQDEVKSLKPEIQKVLEALQSSNKEMVGLQGRLVNALSNVRIPDYTDQLKRLEQSQPDLSPVLKAIQSIEIPENEERPREWEFEIERHRNGLIKSVKARAIDG